MARIAGINIPLNKRVRDRPDVHLRHRPVDREQAPRRQRHLAGHVRPRPHRGRDRQAPRRDRPRPHRRGRPAPRALAEHQAPDGDRLLPRPAPPARPARPRPEHQDQRAHAQGPEAHAGRRQEEGGQEVEPAPRRPQRGRRKPKKNIPIGQAHIKTSLQQHDRVAHRPRGERHRVGVRRRRRLQGLAQVDAVRRAGHRRRRRPQGHRAGPAEGRGLRQGPGLRPRDGDPLALRPPASRSRASATSRRRPTTAAAPASGGASDGPRHEPPVQAVPPRGPEALPQGRALPDRQVRHRAPRVPAGRPRPWPPEAERVPRAAAREAEGPPLLRRAREAVPHLLRQGVAPARHHRREPARRSSRAGSTTSSCASASPARAARRASSSATATGPSTAAASTSPATRFGPATSSPSRRAARPSRSSATPPSSPLRCRRGSRPTTTRSRRRCSASRSGERSPRPVQEQLIVELYSK